MNKVTEWIQAQKSGLAVSGLGERAKVSVTCRLDTLHVQMLERLAEDLGITRTACAEQMLELTITDAWTEWYGKPPIPSEIKQMTDYARLVRQAQELAVLQLSVAGDEESGRLIADARISEIKMLGTLHSIRLSLGGRKVASMNAPIIASFHVSWLEGKDVQGVTDGIIQALRMEVAEGRLPLNEPVLDRIFFDQRFHIRVKQDTVSPPTYRVTFDLKKLQATRGSIGEPIRVPRSPVVEVDLSTTPANTRYEPSEETVQYVTPADYKREATERVYAEQK